MTDFMIGALKNGLSGKGIHIDPLQAVDGLTFEQAKATAGESAHSCYQLLHHIVFWQDLMLEALRGNEVTWPNSNAPSWPANEDLKSYSDWQELITRFREGLDQARAFAETSESEEALRAWRGVPPARALMIFAQHNAYHIGEIVGTRQALGFWPPPGDSQSHF